MEESEIQLKKILMPPSKCLSMRYTFHPIIAPSLTQQQFIVFARLEMIARFCIISFPFGILCTFFCVLVLVVEVDDGTGEWRNKRLSSHYGYCFLITEDKPLSATLDGLFVKNTSSPYRHIGEQLGVPNGIRRG